MSSVGRYYPALSCFGGASVTVNFGKDGFQFPPTDITDYKPICELVCTVCFVFYQSRVQANCYEYPAPVAGAAADVPSAPTEDNTAPPAIAQTSEPSSQTQQTAIQPKPKRAPKRERNPLKSTHSNGNAYMDMTLEQLENEAQTLRKDYEAMRLAMFQVKENPSADEAQHRVLYEEASAKVTLLAKMTVRISQLQQQQQQQEQNPSSQSMSIVKQEPSDTNDELLNEAKRKLSETTAPQPKHIKHEQSIGSENTPKQLGFVGKLFTYLCSNQNEAIRYVCR